MRPPEDELRLISWPYHNGLRGVGMGAGAARLAGDEELRARLRSAGWEVARVEVNPVDETEAEIDRVIELIRRLANEVRAAVEQGAFPLILAGNCNSCLGTVAGVGAAEGVAWWAGDASS